MLSTNAQIEVLRRTARERATATEPGTVECGAVAVRYYPRSSRYGWWVNGERTIVRVVSEALSETRR
jgi:hypothetical protein